jgi:hypothetical protein
MVELVDTSYFFTCKLENTTVKLGDKEHFDKEQIGVKELFTD